MRAYLLRYLMHGHGDETAPDVGVKIVPETGTVFEKIVKRGKAREQGPVPGIGICFF